MAFVQRIMRHSDPRITTETYCHPEPEYLQAGVDSLLKLGTLAGVTADEGTTTVPQTATAANGGTSESASFATRLLLAPATSSRGGHAGARSNRKEFRHLKLSGIRGSNSRHSAWEADALPTELIPQR